ncbi:hypothetical protein ACV3R2_16610 [Clostridium perfringens]
MEIKKGGDSTINSEEEILKIKKGFNKDGNSMIVIAQKDSKL